MVLVRTAIAPRGQPCRQRWPAVRPHLPIRDDVHLAVETGAAEVIAEGIQNAIAGDDLRFITHHHVASLPLGKDSAAGASAAARNCAYCIIVSARANTHELRAVPSSGAQCGDM